MAVSTLFLTLPSRIIWNYLRKLFSFWVTERKKCCQFRWDMNLKFAVVTGRQGDRSGVSSPRVLGSRVDPIFGTSNVFSSEEAVRAGQCGQVIPSLLHDETWTVPQNDTSNLHEYCNGDLKDASVWRAKTEEPHMIGFISPHDGIC